MLGPGSAVLGPCWACVGPSEVFVGAMLANRGAILVASLRNPFFHSCRSRRELCLCVALAVVVVVAISFVVFSVPKWLVGPSVDLVDEVQVYLQTQLEIFKKIFQYPHNITCRKF